MTHVAYLVLDHDTGEQLNYGQLRKHPKFQETWNKYFSNEMGRLCQGVGTGENGLGNGLDGTDTFYVIKFEDIPKERINEICYTSLVCEAPASLKPIVPIRESAPIRYPIPTSKGG